MVKFSMETFRQEQLASGSLKSIDRDLSEKVVIVTGANTGLGYETALHLARLHPARLILACRSAERGQDAIQRIKQQLQEEKSSSEGNIEVWLLDLTDSVSTKAFIDRVNKLERLDVFIANAAVIARPGLKTAAGHDLTVQVNNIATTYVNYNVLPLLKATAQRFPDPAYTPHLTVVSSAAHLLIDDFAESPEKGVIATLDENVIDQQSRYNQTKAINQLDAINLVQRFPEVIVNTVHPGMNSSEILRDLGPSERAFVDSLIEYAWHPSIGSKNIVYAALGNEPTGSYISMTEAQEQSDLLISPRGKELSEKIWAEYQPIWEEIY